jgi:hypothetical protein
VGARLAAAGALRAAGVRLAGAALMVVRRAGARPAAVRRAGARSAAVRLPDCARLAAAGMRRAGVRPAAARSAVPVVIRWSPARKRVAHADSGDDRPLDHPDRAGYSEAGPETQALVSDVAEYGQIHPGRVLLVSVVMAVVLRMVSR